MKQPILICSSDWHMRSTVPCSRAETSWFEVMEQRLDQLCCTFPGVPHLVSGDILDRADPHASLLSFLITRFRQMEIYAIPGNHDLANHRYDAKMSAGYGALVKAGAVRDLEANTWTHVGNMRQGCSVYSQPWSKYLMPPARLEGNFGICALHKYIWMDQTNSYPGAEESANVVSMTEYLKLFDGVSVGDNHISFRVGRIINHGSLLAMTSAQVGHIPKLGVVYDDNTYEAVSFPELEPQWQPTAVQEKVDSIVASLSAMTVSAASFRETLEMRAQQATPAQQVIYYDLIEHMQKRD